MKPTKRPPRFASSMVELARALGVSRKTIQRRRESKDSPAPRSDGRWDIAEWRGYLAGCPLSDEDTESLSELKREQVKLQNDRLKQKIADWDRSHASLDVIEQWG